MRWFLIALGTVVVGAAFNAAVMSASLAGPAVIQGAGGSFSVPVMSLKEKRWTTVVRQQYDFSCGSAAVATLLTYHYETPLAEAVVFEEMFVRGDQAKIQAEGRSEEHTSELQSLMRISYAVFCLKKKNHIN